MLPVPDINDQPQQLCTQCWSYVRKNTPQDIILMRINLCYYKDDFKKPNKEIEYGFKHSR